SAFIFLLGYWVFASFYARYAMLLLAAAAIARAATQLGGLPLFIAPHFLGWAGYGAGIVITSVFLSLAAGAVRSRAYDERPVDLGFPFRNGCGFRRRQRAGQSARELPLRLVHAQGRPDKCVDEIRGGRHTTLPLGQ